VVGRRSRHEGAIAYLVAGIFATLTGAPLDPSGGLVSSRPAETDAEPVDEALAWGLSCGG
jgi:hypothetical protein